MKSKFVEHSKKTAKKNPDMIIREYERIINDINIQISNKEKDFEHLTFNFQITNVDVKSIEEINVTKTVEFEANIKSIRTQITLKKQNNSFGKSEEVSFANGLSGLKFIANTLKQYESSVAFIKDKKKEVEKELTAFKRKYKKTYNAINSNWREH